MLTISKVFTILCILCLCGNSDYPIKMTATKENLNNLEANFDRKMAKCRTYFWSSCRIQLLKLLVQLKSITDLTAMMEIKINKLMKLGY